MDRAPLTSLRSLVRLGIDSPLMEIPGQHPELAHIRTLLNELREDVIQTQPSTAQADAAHLGKGCCSLRKL